jgi:hypothetical protein
MTERDGFNFHQWLDGSFGDALDKRFEGSTVGLALAIVVLFVLAFTDIEGRLDRAQQDVNEGIVHPEKLMGGKAQEVEMSVVLMAAGKVKRVRLEHGMRVVTNAFR